MAVLCQDISLRYEHALVCDLLKLGLLQTLCEQIARSNLIIFIRYYALRSAISPNQIMIISRSTNRIVIELHEKDTSLPLIKKLLNALTYEKENAVNQEHCGKKQICDKILRTIFKISSGHIKTVFYF